MAFKSTAAKLAALLLLLSVGAFAHAGTPSDAGTPSGAGTPSDDVGSLRIALALEQGVDMFQLLKRIDAKDAGELKRELESQKDTDEVTLAQIRLASDMPASACRIDLMDAIERRRVERGLIESAADNGEWVVARTIANTSLRVALDTIDRAPPSTMTPEIRRLADGLKRLVGKWESGYYSL